VSNTVFVLAIFASLAGLWGGLRAVGAFLETAKCASCGYYRPREYMVIIRLDNGKTAYVCDEPGRCIARIEISQKPR
jgi:hypothetical protein